MKYLLPGILLGLIAASLPLFSYTPADSLMPQWYGLRDSVDSIEPSPHVAGKEGKFGILDLNKLTVFNADGSILQDIAAPENMRLMPSGNYEFYALYGKADTKVSLHTLQGERFWAKEAPQYPLLSENAQLVLFLISDLSGIYIRDKNGLPAGAEFIGGKMAVHIDFADEKDSAIAGFISGSYHIIDESGSIVHEMTVPKPNVVKTVSLSPRTLYAAVHYGTVDSDMLRIVDLKDNSFEDVQCEAVHKTRTGLAITDEGEAHIIDGLYYLSYNKDGKRRAEWEIIPQVHGHAKVSLSASATVLSYRSSESTSAAYIFDSQNRLLFKREYQDKALDNEISGSVILLKGTTHLEARTLIQALK